MPAALWVSSGRLPRIIYRVVLFHRKHPKDLAQEQDNSGAVPGSRLLQTDRAANLQSGSPPGRPNPAHYSQQTR